MWWKYLVGGMYQIGGSTRFGGMYQISGSREHKTTGYWVEVVYFNSYTTALDYFYTWVGVVALG